jgi:hypothetical protein
MRGLIALLVALGLAPGSAAQMPARFESVELARSRECVDVLARLDALDATLAPLASRSQRLVVLAQAIAIEDPDAIDSLDASDPIEAAVGAWFAADAELAQRYLAQPNPALLEERTAARATIQASVTAALQALQAEADAMIAATGDLQQRAGQCDGAVFVRGAVVEACGGASSAVCAAARDTARVDPYRFVESAEVLWGLQEFRAWTAPAPLRPTADGQLTGGRTLGITRTGNLVVTLAFGPLLQGRVSLAPETAAAFLALADSLGFGAAHPDVVFVPSLAIHATLHAPLDEESSYLFHFGPPEEADILWAAGTATGAAVEGIVPLTSRHLARLQAGEPITLTAVREAEPGVNDALYAIELTSINQGPAVQALVGYMAGQLPAELLRMIPPDSSAAPTAPSP